MSSENLIPQEGLYVSKKDPSMRLSVIEVIEVDVLDNEEEDGGDKVFYTVLFVKEGDEDDMSAQTFEYDPDEWQRFVKKSSA
ncbi:MULTISPECIES: hypothetical protein [Symbiopectobacterium]|uniref:hypothetical protein n=1 Tax=Symbiopectobacterium TaxID=801 RepID=UPI001A2947B4|nr:MULTISPECIES: hypothetical protein [Symbiopectobacterium]MBG6247322.1 hypothetical protein [Candidatus Symbiopectobacterium sp. PLON1]MBT9429494.1 hypothetical protein [Candidatus Symbiopectobacterium endolongispinus]